MIQTVFQGITDKDIIEVRVFRLKEYLVEVL
jgi:hypothetical protein